MPTVAQHIIAALEASGIARVYGLPGDSLNGFTDAIRRSGQIGWEHVRHEEAAAFATAADAALTGGLAVCAGSRGPRNLLILERLPEQGAHPALVGQRHQLGQQPTLPDARRTLNDQHTPTPRHQRPHQSADHRQLARPPPNRRSHEPLAADIKSGG